MDRNYTKEIDEWTRWYSYHRESMKNAPLEKKVAFLERAVLGLMKISCLTYEEIERVDAGRDKPLQLFLPAGVTLNEAIRSDSK